MSLLKKAVVYLSVAALAAPIVASGTVGVATAATTDANVKTTQTAKPNANLKVPLRDANNIFKLKLEKEENGYVLVSNIAASGNNVIQKGEQLVLNFDKTNVDLNNSAVINQDGKLPYSVKKDADKGTVTITFNQDVDSGNYESAVGIATKNLYTTSKVKANFEGADVKVADNSIVSKWQSPQTLTTSQGTTSQQTQYSTTQTSQQAASSYSTSSSQATTGTTTSTGTTTQSQAEQGYTPTYQEVEKAVMGRTTISVSGTATNTDETQTSANVATTKTATGQTVNNVLPASSATPANTTDQVASTNNTTSTDVAANQATDTTGTDQAATTTTNTATTNEQVAPVQQATAQQAQTKVQADAATSNVIQTPNGKPSDPEQTLKDYLENNDNNPQGDKTTYEDNKTFEQTKQDIIDKVPAATAEEQAEIVKVQPHIWSYISKAADQNQSFTFATLLSTGRTAYTTINGVADTNSNDIFQQNMPKLLKSFGENIADDAFDKAVDIDVLLDSQVYQDYLAGKYQPASEKLNANDAWKAISDNMTITQVDANTDVAGAQKLDLRTYNAQATLDDLAAQEVAKQNSEKADQLVINKETSKDVATTATETEDTSKSTGNQLFNQMQQSVGEKLPSASYTDRQEILGALPGILNSISNATSSSDKTGSVTKYLQPTTDGNSYLITMNTTPVTGSSDKYLANLPQIFKSFGDSLREGDFDKAISMQVMENSQIYQDYKDGKYVPSALQTKKTVNNSEDLLPAIILAMIAFPLAALVMGVVTVLTSPIWVPLAIITWGIVFAITAMPIVFIYTVLGALIIPSLILFPIMLVVSLFAAPILLLLNLVPIINLITIPITVILLALTFIPGFIVLTFIPMIILAAAIVIAGIAIPIIMTVGLVIAQVIAGILTILAGGLLAMLLPITALLGLIIAGLFSLLGLIGFALIAGLIMGIVLGLVIAGFAVLTVVAGGFAGVIGLGLIVGLAVVLLGYLAFNFAGMLAGIAIFLILLVLMPQFLVLNFLLWFIGFGFMALLLPDLAIVGLELAVVIGGLMMLFFIPGLLIALSWPFWMGLVLAISIPIIEIAIVIALPFSFIPLFGWIADAIVGVMILIQAIVLAASIVIPIVIGVLMMTVGIIGFDIAAAAALVLELIKKKEVAERIHVNIDPSWRLKIHPVGFWTKSDPLLAALA